MIDDDDDYYNPDDDHEVSVDDMSAFFRAARMTPELAEIERRKTSVSFAISYYYQGAAKPSDNPTELVECAERIDAFLRGDGLPAGKPPLRVV